jgi:hypothetical protein
MLDEWWIAKDWNETVVAKLQHYTAILLLGTEENIESLS